MFSYVSEHETVCNM